MAKTKKITAVETNNKHIATDKRDEFNEKFNQLLEEKNKVDEFESLIAKLNPLDVSDEELIAEANKEDEESSNENESDSKDNGSYTLEQFKNDYNRENLFGKYEVVYSTSENIPDKFTTLKEDATMDEKQHVSDVQIIEAAENLCKNQQERKEIANLYQPNGKFINISEVRGLIEASIFVLGSNGLNLYDIRKVTELPVPIVKSILDEMMEYYNNNKNSGLLLVQYGNRYKFVTKAQYNEQIGLVINQKVRKPLSDGALETLSIIAYNQPCTKGTVEKIRGRDCTNTIRRLLDLNLIEADEKSDAIGKPWLYCVSQKFYDLYGIKSLAELPPIDRQAKHYDDETGAKDQIIIDEE